MPDSKIIVFSILPRQPGPANERVNAINAVLPTIADQKQVFHVDINQSFLDRRGRQITGHFVRDRLHLSPRGYAAWAKALKPLLEKEGLQINLNAPAPPRK